MLQGDKRKLELSVEYYYIGKSTNLVKNKLNKIILQHELDNTDKKIIIEDKISKDGNVGFKYERTWHFIVEFYSRNN